MAASDSPPPNNTKHASGGWPSGSAALIRPKWCDGWSPDMPKPHEWCQICGC
ncbi:hypothetical protein [Salmonella enterica]|uniref:hypothetical protein n=1 Tax=Salmonella enterica TaxID=28901 RepID=UPI003AF85427